MNYQRMRVAKALITANEEAAKGHHVLVLFPCQTQWGRIVRIVVEILYGAHVKPYWPEETVCVRYTTFPGNLQGMFVDTVVRVAKDSTHFNEEAMILAEHKMAGSLVRKVIDV